jgi:hypothetical protein
MRKPVTEPSAQYNTFLQLALMGATTVSPLVNFDTDLPLTGLQRVERLCTSNELISVTQVHCRRYDGLEWALVHRQQRCQGLDEMISTSKHISIRYSMYRRSSDLML